MRVFSEYKLPRVLDVAVLAALAMLVDWVQTATDA
jgi:hypothetical protein